MDLQTCFFSLNAVVGTLGAPAERRPVIHLAFFLNASEKQFSSFQISWQSNQANIFLSRCHILMKKVLWYESIATLHLGFLPLLKTSALNLHITEALWGRLSLLAVRTNRKVCCLALQFGWANFVFLATARSQIKILCRILLGPFLSLFVKPKLSGIPNLTVLYGIWIFISLATSHLSEFLFHLAVPIFNRSCFLRI